MYSMHCDVPLPSSLLPDALVHCVGHGCSQETANTSFSPDGRVLVCGSNVRPKSNATGVLKFFDVYTAEAEPELGEGKGVLTWFYCAV